MTFHPLQVLAHVERRHIIAELAVSEDAIDLLAVCASGDVGAPTAEVLNDIVFYHLPKMAEHGYVSFDGAAGTVSRGPRFDAIRPYLGSTNGHRASAEPE